MPRLLVLSALLAFVPSCSSEDDPEGDPPVDDGLPAGTIALDHTFPTAVIRSGEEDGGLCQAWTLNNDEPLYVNVVEVFNDGGYHHSNWFFVPEDLYVQPEGHFRCSEHNFDEVTAALAGGVLYAQSTQARAERQRFRTGAVVVIPPRSRIITSTHLYNTTPSDITTSLRLTLHSIPESAVQTRLQPFRLGYGDLEIPPRTTSEFRADCGELREEHAALMGTPWSMKLHYVLPHTHALGVRLTLRIMGGPRDGETIVDTPVGNGEANGVAFLEPLDLSDADGLSFSCVFSNPRDETVGWGIGESEMCEFLGYAELDAAFDGWVRQGERQGENAEGQALYTGPCRITAFPRP